MEKILRVGFLLTPSMLTTGTAYPYEMWAAAFEHAFANRRGIDGRLHLISVSSNQQAGRLPLRAEFELGDCPSLDVVYLPALWRKPRVVLNLEPSLVPWIKSAYREGAKIAAVGTGVCLLAATGLLDERPATTHWYYFDEFKKNYPKVDLRPEFFITQSESLYCAASINSLADISVHLIEIFLGAETALHVERNFSHEIRRDYKKQSFLAGGEAPSNDEVVIEALAWIMENIGAGFSIDYMAEKLGISRRTLDRRFKAATGVSLRTFWQKQKIKMARELLSETDLPVGEVAWRVGYSDGGYFSHLFRREMSVTPLEYRKTVRAKLFSDSN